MGIGSDATRNSKGALDLNADCYGDMNWDRWAPIWTCMRVSISGYEGIPTRIPARTHRWSIFVIVIVTSLFLFTALYIAGRLVGGWVASKQILRTYRGRYVPTRLGMSTVFDLILTYSLLTIIETHDNKHATTTTTADYITLYNDFGKGGTIPLHIPGERWTSRGNRLRHYHTNKYYTIK